MLSFYGNFAVRPTSEADVSVIVKMANAANMPISIRRYASQKNCKQRLLKHFEISTFEHCGLQWRAQLHVHEHQGELGAHRHAGDGLH